MPTEDRPLYFGSYFNEVAADYDAVRPGYPPALFDDIVRLAELPRPARILEIGCGTGQATRPFAERGDYLTCLDIGPDLLALARQTFAGYPHVTFHQRAFEDWPAEPGAYDLVMSATAFHWIDPAVGYPRAAALLNDSGALAVFANEHRPFPPDFAAALYDVERSVVPDWPDGHTPPDLDAAIARTAAAIDATGLFSPAIVRTYPWTQTYPTAAYLRLINTYSNYRHLELARRARLFNAIGDFIDRRLGGAIEKSYLAVLYLARKANNVSPGMPVTNRSGNWC